MKITKYICYKFFNIDHIDLKEEVVEEAQHLEGPRSGWCLEPQGELLEGGQVVVQGDLGEGGSLLVLHRVVACAQEAQGDHALLVARALLAVHDLVAHALPVDHALLVVHGLGVRDLVARDLVARDLVARDLLAVHDLVARDLLVVHDLVACDLLAVHDLGVHAVGRPYQVEGPAVVAALAVVAWAACGHLVGEAEVRPLVVAVWVAYHRVEAGSACEVDLQVVGDRPVVRLMVGVVHVVVLDQGLGDHVVGDHPGLLGVHQIQGVDAKEAHCLP